MSVDVHVPIRIKTDSKALKDCPDLMDEALQTSITRALKNSCDVVLSKRGFYQKLCLHVPEYIWSGEGANSLSVVQRQAVERRISEIINQCLNTGDMAGYSGKYETLPVPLSEPPEEKIDVNRYESLMSMYSLPSYEGQGEPAIIPVAKKAEPDENVKIEYGYTWSYLPDDKTFWAKLKEALYEFSIAVPQTGYIGIIYVWKGNDTYLNIYTLPNENKLFGAVLNNFKTIKLVDEGEKLHFNWVQVEFPPGATYRVQYYKPGKTKEERLLAFYEFFHESMKKKISAYFNSRKIITEKDISSEKIEEYIILSCQEQVDMLSAQANSTKCFILLYINGMRHLIYTNFDIPQNLNCDVVPLAQQASFISFSDTDGDGSRKSKKTGEDDGDTESKQGGQPITYPPAFSFGGKDFVCEPLLGEPPLVVFGEDGQRMQRLINKIAALLDIPACSFAAKFCVNAAEALGNRAFAVGQYSSMTQSMTSLYQESGGSSGNIGYLEIRPNVSQGILFMRLLATIAPDITLLSRIIRYVYEKAEHRQFFSGTWAKDTVGWNLHFLMELTPGFRHSIGIIFGRTCQILLLQLLRSSKKEIEKRLAAIGSYAANFEAFMYPMLLKLEDLTALRETLKTYNQISGINDVIDQAIPDNPAAQFLLAATPATGWAIATQKLLEAFTIYKQPSTGTPGKRGQIQIGKDKKAAVFDDAGRLWTMEALEQAIRVRRGLVENFDPLVKQMVEMDEVMQRFKDSTIGVKAELMRILTEMRKKNAEILEKTQNSWEFAFKASRIQENLKYRTIPHTCYALQGVHLMAHEAIGSYFRDDVHYGLGVKDLFSFVLGKEKLLGFFEFFGIALLSVICPPLGVAAGIASAVYQYYKASEKEDIYKSLMDPDLVLSWAEVEIELFVAKLGLALSIIPDAGALVAKGVSKGIRLGVRGSMRAAFKSGKGLVKGGVRGAAKSISFQLSKEIVEQIEKGLVKEFMKQIIIGEAMNLLLEQMLNPIIAGMQAEIKVTGPGGGR